MKPITILKLALLLTALLICRLAGAEPGSGSKPNVIIVITDDQGYGDLGCHGNQVIRTPGLDAFHEEAVRLTNFHVSPTCAPTRAALMTGRYTNRTGCWHTIAGRSQLYEDEMTMAEVFARNGYRTGMFGKWHLGDNYPFRPGDRGFHEVVRHGGGGITQGPDYWGNDYFDDTYWHNGVPEEYTGYCTDVFFAEALKFIEENREKPFFCYISTNAPHGPLHLPEAYYRMYEKEDRILDNQKRFYGMITNIDDNFIKLEEKLSGLGLKDNTILVFMTDNGTASGITVREGKVYGNDGGMRGVKGSEYDGGHRVPFFIRWPDGGISGGIDIARLTAHIDVLPTLVELCDMKFLPLKPIDGRSLVPLLRGEGSSWDNRMLIVDSQRLQDLVKWRKCAVMDDQWRLINGKELYHIIKDPKQQDDVSQQYPEVAGRLATAYEKWWQSLRDEGVNQRYAYIRAGTAFENPVRVSAHDMHTGMLGSAWNQNGALRVSSSRARGHFKVEFARPGDYRISLCRYPRESGLSFNEHVPAREESLQVSAPMPESEDVDFVRAGLCLGDFSSSVEIQEDTREAVFNLYMEAGKYDMETVLTDATGGTTTAYYIYIEKR